MGLKFIVRFGIVYWRIERERAWSEIDKDGMYETKQVAI